MKKLPVLDLTDRLENLTRLDPIIERVRAIVNAVVRPRAVRDLLHGVPIGHPVHPLMVQVPLGAWVSTAVLDAIPGTQHAARALVGVGVVTAVPTALAGYTDWSELHEQQQRVGLAHSMANLVATGFYAASFIQRSRGRHGSGKTLSYAGLLVAAAGGYLGGHLTYRQAAGVNHTEDVPHLFPQGWHQLGPSDEIADDTLEHRVVQGVSVLAYREGGDIHVISDVCSHLSGPLHEGEIVRGGGGDPCVECPWHQSVFSLRSGEVVHGPATSPQPRFSTRVVDGVVEISLPGAG